MLFTVPNSGGLPEPEQALVSPLSETWSDEARAASAAVRRTRSKYQTKDDKKRRRQNLDPSTPPRINDATIKQVGDKVKARTQGEKDAQKTAVASYQQIAADKEAVKARAAKAAAAEEKAKKKGGGGGGKETPTVDHEAHNAQGERVLHYSDGSTVTVHKDGAATHRKADGTETTGKYHDPTPAQPKDTPKGFHADTPESKAKDAEHANKKAETERKKAERERAKAARPVKQRTLRVRLSRTKRGPRAA